MEEKKKRFYLVANIKEKDLGREFEEGLMNLILLVAGKLKEDELVISKLNFEINIYVNHNERSDIGFCRIIIKHSEGFNSAIIKIRGGGNKVFDEKFYELDEIKQKRIRTWYCPIKRLEKIKSVKEILDYYKFKIGSK